VPLHRVVHQTTSVGTNRPSVEHVLPAELVARVMGGGWWVDELVGWSVGGLVVGAVGDGSAPSHVIRTARCSAQ
jgi:hypothetical protein